jgi:hypothetical protein
MELHLGKGDGTFQAPQPTTFGFTGAAASAAAGDFNGDGKLDLYTNVVQGVGLFLLGSGAGTWSTINQYTSFPSTYQAVAADFNRDGKLDVATATEGPRVLLIAGNGDGTIGNLGQYSFGSYSYGIATADFNGDGKPDLAVTDQSGAKVYVLLNTGP